LGGDIWSPVSIDGHRYTGGNRVALAMAAMLKGYSSGTWGTYKAWQRVGGQVRKGEKATGILRPLTMTRTDDDGDEHQYTMWAGLAVFNAAQVDGWTPKTDRSDTKKVEPIAQAEQFTADVIATHGIQIVNDPGRAYYSPTRDVIGMPRIEQFDNG